MSESARPTTRLALIVEYDGTNYKGFQYQTSVPTIQHELEKAIGNLTGEEVRVRGASRTDSGVHAAGQVVDFLSKACFPEDTWIRGLNYYLPWDIKIKRVYRVPCGFHARKDAVARTYRYTILNSKTPSPLLNNRCAWIETSLDSQYMEQAAQALIGVHDLSAFAAPLAPQKTGVRRVKRWDVWREEDLVLVEAEANGFLPHQILRTNGILIEIGKGKAPVSMVQDVLKGSIIKANLALALPAKGLCLLRVDYSNFPLEES